MAPRKTPAGDNAQDVWVVLLCGLPGSGKSTVRARLNKGWAYVSQDEMGTADACEKALIKALKAGQSCVIDRCNVTPSERRLWLQHANHAVEKGLVKGVTLHFEAVWMATPPEVCKQRAGAREAHETLNGEDAGDVIDKFCKGLRIPERCGPEPYEAVLVIANTEDVDRVLQRYADPLKVDKLVLTITTSAAVVAAPPQKIFIDAETVEDDFETDVVAGGLAELFVLRHGERADRAKGRDDGWADDVALTKEGRETAKRAGVALSSLVSLPCAAVYSSPFYRCLQTANEVAAELGLPVKVEPGLSELCSQKIFEEAPRLRDPAISLRDALTRVEADANVPPVWQGLPQWPEEARDANARVIGTARALAARHAGRSVILVCHSHSAVEITRHLPSEGGGAASSTAGYCALSHISRNGGRLLRCLDQSYLKGAGEQSSGFLENPFAPVMRDTLHGHWADGWQWVAQGAADGDIERDPIDKLFEMDLDDVLDRYPKFKAIFSRGTQRQAEVWRQGWATRDEALRGKLERAIAAKIFE